MKLKTISLGIFLAGLSTVFAYTIGQTCFSKQANTGLLSEPDRFATRVVSVEWGKPLTIISVSGRWLEVSSDNRKGWVYAGNVTSQKPPAENKNDFLPKSAADTTAAVAARPLSEASRQYAGRKSMDEAASDIEWAEQQAALVTAEKVDLHMQDKNLGDYGK